MITKNDAINAAASYVAENAEVFRAAFDANRDKVRGQSSNTVRQYLRDAVAGRGDNFNAVKTAARWLSDSQYLAEGVRQGVGAGTLPYGTTTAQAQEFLHEALGVRAEAPVAAPKVEAPAPADTLRDEFAQALAAAGTTGRVRITVDTDVEGLRDLLGL